MNSTVELTEPKAINCPNCKSAHIVKIGTRNGYQRYLCRACSKKFHANGKAAGRRFPADQMGAAIRLFYSGMSYKQIAESMETMYDIPQPSKATIYEWVRDYTKAALREMERHPAHTGGRWVVDDMQLNVAGQKYWIWNVMDEGTRYLLASHLTKERDARSAEAVLKKAVAAATDPPRTVRTDRRRYYIPAVKNVVPDARHIQSTSVRDWKNNNLSEGVQDAFRQRTQSLRGVSSKEGVHLYLGGWMLSYNLFIDHESMDGKLSGRAAKVDAPFNEWADVVRKVASYSGPKLRGVTHPRRRRREAICPQQPQARPATHPRRRGREAICPQQPQARPATHPRRRGREAICPQQPQARPATHPRRRGRGYHGATFTQAVQG